MEDFLSQNWDYIGLLLLNAFTFFFGKKQGKKQSDNK